MKIHTLFFTLLAQTSLNFQIADSKPYENAKPLILPLKIQENSNKKLPFTHNITLTASLSVGIPPQNVTMVLDTGSELSWLRCTNKTTPPAFNPTLSRSYSPIPCTSPTCTTRTLDFSIPASCDSRNLCHAILSYADASSSEGNLAIDNFTVVGESLPAAVFGCMDSGFSTNSAEDLKSTGLLGMNRGSLSFVKQMGFGKFSYCISGVDDSGILMLGESPSSNFTRLLDLNYTPLIEISNPLPYFDREAYTVRLEGIKVDGKWLPLPKSVLEPDHTGAGQTMVDSGTQFTFLLGPAYTALRNEFVNRTAGILRVLDEPDFVFQGAFDLCFRVALNATEFPDDLPTVSMVFRGAEITVSGEQLLYRVAGEVRGGDSVRCLTFGNSDLAGIEAYIVGHYHQQNLWMEFDLENSRIGIGKAQCDMAGRRFGVYG